MTFLPFIEFSNSYKRRALFPRGLIAGIEKALRNKLTTSNADQDYRFGIYCFFSYALKLPNKSNSFQYIFQGGLVFPGELIIDWISNYTRVVSRLSWSDVFYGLITGGWVIAWGVVVGVRAYKRQFTVFPFGNFKCVCSN